MPEVLFTEHGLLGKPIRTFLAAMLRSLLGSRHPIENEHGHMGAVQHPLSKWEMPNDSAALEVPNIARSVS